ncbi:hypothetical protein, partial [Streptomyces griseofuscus]|uniref:hypothetical protein n=1 Tax=Streptomyces griseofuscus TaxID=146922 RepID=UPI00055F9BF5
MQHRRRTHTQTTSHLTHGGGCRLVESHGGLGHACAIAPHIQHRERRGRLRDIAEEGGEELLVFGDRDPEPRLCDEVPERQRRRQLPLTALQEGLDLG